MAEFPRTSSTSICNGGTLWILKKALEANLKSEKQLIDLVKTCEKGFPSIAAGIQLLYSKRRKTLVKLVKNKITSKLSLESDKSPKKENEIRKELDREAGIESNNLKNFTFLCSLKLSQKLDFIYGIEESFDKHNEYNDLPSGCYKINFECGESGHAIAYLKYSFGSYLIDSNYGLSRCSEKPANELIKLLNTYKPSEQNAKLRPIDMYAANSI